MALFIVTDQKNKKERKQENTFNLKYGSKYRTEKTGLAPKGKARSCA